MSFEPITFRLNKENILDCYIYGGCLIIIFNDGVIKTLPLSSIFYPLYNTYEKYKTIFELSLLRNDWLDNPQACNFLRSKSILEEFKHLWTQVLQIRRTHTMK